MTIDCYMNIVGAVFLTAAALAIIVLVGVLIMAAIKTLRD